VQPIGNPAPDRSQMATAMVEDSPVGNAYLSVRVCSESGPAPIWDDSSLECALARDLILASGGLPGDTAGPALIARFDSVTSAASAARRLQWGAQGLSEASRAYALSILIQSGEEVARGQQTPSEHINAGSIMVTDAAARLLEEAPGFSVRSKGKGAQYREISWRAAANLTTREADERVLAQMIEKNGRATAAATVEIAPEPDIALQPAEWAEPEPRRASRTLLWIGLAAVLVAGAVAAFFFFRPGTDQKVAAVTPAQQTPAPAENSSAPVSTPPQHAPTSVNPPSESAQPLTRKQQREQQKKEREQAAAAAAAAKANTPQPQPQPAPPPPKPDNKPPEGVSGSCQYPSDQLPGLLDSAETARGRGKYSDALRKVNNVLSCQPGNAKARDLKGQIQQAIAAQNGSDPN